MKLNAICYASSTVYDRQLKMHNILHTQQLLCAFYEGHKGSVTCVNWSHDGRWLLTSSDDHAACVWALGFPDPLMSINLVNNNFGVDREGGLKSTMVRKS